LSGKVVSALRNADFYLPAALSSEFPHAGKNFRSAATTSSGVYKEQVCCVRIGVRGSLHKAAMLTEQSPSVNSSWPHGAGNF
jgi:hypothetical protein